MFKPEHIHHTNANQIGFHAPETLLVVAVDVVRKKHDGWNNVFHSVLGSYYRLLGPTGEPLFPPIQMLKSDLKGVRIHEHDEEASTAAETLLGESSRISELPGKRTDDKQPGSKPREKKGKK
jgi:hypothetical protein